MNQLGILQSRLLVTNREKWLTKTSIKLEFKQRSEQEEGAAEREKMFFKCHVLVWLDVLVLAGDTRVHKLTLTCRQRFHFNDLPKFD